MASPHGTKHAVKLVDRKNRGGWIVYRRRQRLEGDVNHNTKRKGRVLLHGALGAERQCRTQDIDVEFAVSAIEVEQRLINRDEVADLRDELDDTVPSLGLGLDRIDVDRQNDSRRSLMSNEAFGPLLFMLATARGRGASA